jgi:hypothetical protein
MKDAKPGRGSSKTSQAFPGTKVAVSGEVIPSKVTRHDPKVATLTNKVSTCH